MKKWRRFVLERCVSCGKMCHKKDEEYIYRYSYVNEAGHSDYDFYCKKCGEREKNKSTT